MPEGRPGLPIIKAGRPGQLASISFQFCTWYCFTLTLLKMYIGIYPPQKKKRKSDHRLQKHRWNSHISSASPLCCFRVSTTAALRFVGSGWPWFELNPKKCASQIIQLNIYLETNAVSLCDDAKNISKTWYSKLFPCRDISSQFDLILAMFCEFSFFMFFIYI